MLKAYIDDSKMGAPPVYVLGGWVAPPKVWATFSDAWSEILRMSPRIEYFKFAEAMNFNGQFGGLSERSRDEKLKLLVNTVADFQLVGISVSIPHDLFAQNFGTNPNPDIRNPYVLAFFALISRLVEYFSETGYKDKIEFVFDEQPTARAMARVERAWQTFVRTAEPEWKHLLPDHMPTFQDDRKIVALQAADLHAGWIRSMNSAAYERLPQPIPVWGDVGDRILRIYRHINSENVSDVYKYVQKRYYA